jgi:hypothetical protein
MSQDCHIYLPQDTRFDDICDVIGILLGQKKELCSLDKDGVYCHVKEVKKDYDYKNSRPTSLNDTKENIFVLPTFSPEYWVIYIKNNRIDKVWHQGNFHFETEDNMKLLSGGSTEFWIKIGKALVEFFGGYVDYNDCDEVEKDFIKDKPRIKNNPNDGEEWNNFEREKFNLEPIV